MYDKGDGLGERKFIYQSQGPGGGGPQYNEIVDDELGDWNIWLWHDGVVR